ncbi:hypothetical protein MPLA_2130054 [Mesorhizobium sp. ORS 3359]|nr:hypothetical protein MPLA_2130054 [Mesorhizobium sp. ORS 3359]
MRRHKSTAPPLTRPLLECSIILLAKARPDRSKWKVSSLSMRNGTADIFTPREPDDIVAALKATGFRERFEGRARKRGGPSLQVCET